jgi:hypothetical protein
MAAATNVATIQGNTFFNITRASSYYLMDINSYRGFLSFDQNTFTQNTANPIRWNVNPISTPRSSITYTAITGNIAPAAGQAAVYFSYASGSSVDMRNNFFSNPTFTFEVRVSSPTSDPYNATNNYWGVRYSATIGARIYDFTDSNAVAAVIFTPFSANNQSCDGVANCSGHVLH